MTATEITAGSVELSHDISRKQDRYVALETQIAGLERELATLQDDAARAIADGRAQPRDAGTRARSLEEQIAGMRRALGILDADIGRLQHELKAATAAEAAQDATHAAAGAVTALNDFDAVLRALVTTELLPALRILDSAFETARQATQRSETLNHALVRTSWQGDPVSPDVAARRAPALRLRAALHAFLRETCVEATATDDVPADEVPTEEVADVVA